MGDRLPLFVSDQRLITDIFYPQMAQIGADYFESRLLGVGRPVCLRFPVASLVFSAESAKHTQPRASRAKKRATPWAILGRAFGVENQRQQKTANYQSVTGYSLFVIGRSMIWQRHHAKGMSSDR
ncbi:MAG: hypothetical protein ACOX9E_04740 [Lentisphaeria bacterium]|jgi:hypothetical protein